MCEVHKLKPQNERFCPHFIILVMIRITAGKHKNRKVATQLKGKPVVEFRPTAERTRQAIFNILENSKFIPERFIEDAVVADLFCGSGSFGLEAISRGGKEVYFIDSSLEQIQLVKANVAHIKEEDRAHYIRCDVNFLPLARKQCNIIYLDPPYNSKMVEKVLDRLVEQKWLAEHHVIIIEVGIREKLILNDNFEIFDEREYGKTKVVFCSYKPK